LGEGWGEGLSIEPPSYAPLPRPFSEREKGDIKKTVEFSQRTRRNIFFAALCDLFASFAFKISARLHTTQKQDVLF
jgi:hypothetical protein